MAESPRPDLTVSIINTNNRDLLRQCLTTLFENTHGISMEVYVVDNVCTDGSAEMVRADFPEVRLLQNETRLRFCANHNQVLREARGRILLILNEDTEITPHALDDLVAFMDEHPDAGVTGVAVLNPDGTLQGSYNEFPTLFSRLVMALGLNRLGEDAFYPFHPLPADGNAVETDWVGGACLAVRAEAAEQAGLMNEAFLIYDEETDWCYRMKSMGWKVYFVPSVRIVHYQGKGTNQERPRRRFRINRSALLFFKTHYGALSTLGLKLVFVLTSLGRIIVWTPLYGWGRRRERAALELKYNWRTILICLTRDDRYDGELFVMS